MSLFYFQTVVGWMYGQMTVGDVVVQGLIESTVFGLILSVVLTTTYVAVTRARCPVREVFKILVIAAVCTITAWAIGGTLGLLWAVVSPRSFGTAFDLIPQNVPSLAAWGWVGGSIWSVYFGGFLTIVGAPISLHFVWRELRGWRG